MVGAVALVFRAVLVLAVAAWWFSRGAAARTEEYVPEPREATALDAALGAYDAAYGETFKYRVAVPDDDPRRNAAVLESLFDARDDVLRVLGEMRQALPNDGDLERRFLRYAEGIERRVAEDVDDARSRLRIYIHPGPISTVLDDLRGTQT